MRILFGVDSVFQLMTAVNLRMTIYKDDEADIIIYNSTKNADILCNKLKETEVFKNCYLARTPLTYCGDKYTLKEKVPKYFIYLATLVVPQKIIKSICNEFGGHYDIFLFNGEGALPECIYNACKKENKNLVCYRFEDSYFSYTQEYGSQKSKSRLFLENVAQKLFNRCGIKEDIKGYYFAEPGLVQYKFDYPVIPAPKFSRDNKELISVLNHVFELRKIDDDYHEKYIFFECGDAFFFNNNEDIEFVNKLIEIVGKDNILIKRHPRIRENRFGALGVHIAKGESVPWELIQLNTPLSGKVFLTTKSAAAMTSEVYFGDKCSAMLLYEGVKGNQGEISENFEKYMMAFSQKSKNGFWMPKDMQEFEHIVKEIENS